MTVMKPTDPPRNPPTATTTGYGGDEDHRGREIVTASEVGQASLVAAARAEEESAYIVAHRFPRDFDDARTKILAMCRRPRFANQPPKNSGQVGALYEKPMGGGKVIGFTIHFAHAAAQAWRNLRARRALIYDDPSKRIKRVVVTDLESGMSYGDDVTVMKCVERTNADGRQVLSVRTNSEGKRTFTVIATEDEMLAKENSLCSKAERNLILNHIPRDVQDEARDAIMQTRADKFAADPDAERKRHADVWAGIGVSAAELKAYLGHDLAQMTEPESQELGNLYNAIVDGELTWASAMEAKRGAGEVKPAAGEPKQLPESAKTTGQVVKEILKAKAEASRPLPQPNVTPAAPAAPACPAEVLASVFSRLNTYAGKLSDADQAALVDRLLGGVGLKSLESLNEPLARQAVALLDGEIAKDATAKAKAKKS